MNNQIEKENRIQAIKKMRWIDYPKSKEILAILNDLLKHQGTTRIPNPFIIGDSNSGKTELLKRFFKLNPPQIIPGNDYIVVPVLYTISPPMPSEQRLYNEILHTLKIPHRERTDIDYKMRLTIDSILKLNCKVIIIDEIQHIMSVSPKKQREFLNTIKYIMNKTGVSFVCAGVNEAHRVVATDPQLANRFTPIELKPWKIDKEYVELLLTYKKSLNLINEDSKIDLEFVKYVHSHTEGLIGEAIQLMQKAAIYAITSEKENLDLECIKSIEWIKPSERRNQY